LTIPYLYLSSAQDSIKTLGLTAELKDYTNDLLIFTVEDFGHFSTNFATKEKPKELSGCIVNWLATKFPR